MRPVSAIMKTNVKFIRPNSTIKEAADKMRMSNVGALPVCEGDQVLGILTDRDIAVRAVAKDRKPGETRVREIMSSKLISVLENEDVSKAVQQMNYRKVGRLVVLAPDNRLRGIVSLGDIVRRLGEKRVAGLVGEKIFKTGKELPSRFTALNMRNRRSWAIGLGTLAGLSAAFAGVSMFRRRSNMQKASGAVKRFKNRLNWKAA